MAIKHEEWEEIARLYREKVLTIDELCWIYHCSKEKLIRGIGKIPKTPKTTDPPTPSKQALIDEIIADKYGFGMSTKLIAEKHHLCVSTVQKYLRENKSSPTAKKR